MTNRKAMSKSKRFEIFKRDNFKCLYCGVTPAQKVLRVDHVVPVAEGGTDDPMNLVTACFDCNAGKAARTMDSKRFKAEFATDADKEHAEQIREWLEIQRSIDAARAEVAEQFAGYWEEHLGPISQEMKSRLPKLSKEWPADRITQAIAITAAKLGMPYKGEYDYRHAKKQQQYFHGILRRWREEDTPAPPPPPEPPARPPSSVRCQEALRRLLAIQASWAPDSGKNISDLIRAFELVAYARPDEAGAEWSKECPEVGCRGLIFKTRMKGTGHVAWWVEDDPEWRIEGDRHSTEAMSAVFALECALVHDPDIEKAREAWNLLSRSQNESTHFTEFHRNQAHETTLRKRRTEIGWPNPPEGL